MQAIIAKYVPPTNTKPGRVKATCERGSITVSWDHGLEAGENMRAACDALCARFDAEDFKKYGALSEKGRWGRPKASGQIPSGEYVFCFIPERVYLRSQSDLLAACELLINAEAMQQGSRTGGTMAAISSAIDAARAAIAKAKGDA